MKVIILAAGRGKRLQTAGPAFPKVLFPLCGKPLIAYVAQKLPQIPKEQICIVVGFMKEQVMAALPGYAFAEQTAQLGTGHAVLAAEDFLRGEEENVLVLYGDMPMFRAETYRALMETHCRAQADVTLLTCDCKTRPLAYGRVLRGADGALRDIVEERDCTPAQKAVTELNVGVYVFRIRPMLRYLKTLQCDNAQQEYYLTDLPKIMQLHGCKLATFQTADENEVIGINTQEDLALCETLLKSCP